MICYRVHADSRSNYVFSGDGGLFVAGRWNFQGRKIVYTSQSLSLCTLEWLSHNGLSVASFSIFRYSIEVPDGEIKWFKLPQLPKGWNLTPATDLPRRFVENELFENEARLAIAVPSVMVPEEYNILLNPLHTHYPEIQRTIKSLGPHKAPDRS